MKGRIKMALLFALPFALCGCGEPNDKAKGFKVYDGHVFLWTNHNAWSNGEWVHDPQCPECATIKNGTTE